MRPIVIATRLFARQPGLTLAAVLSLALGIGANTAIFTVLNSIVLRPLPYPAADRLVAVWETSADNPARWVAPANYVDWKRETRSFASLSAFDTYSVNLTGRGEPERLRAAGASGDFFQTLGVQAQMGRALVAEDDRPGAAPVAVLTHGLWQRLFGGEASALGVPLTLDGRAHTIVGVLPAGFSMPMVANAEIWLSSDRGVPRSFPFPGDITAVRDSHVLFVVGRLSDGVSSEAAQQELASVMQRLERDYPQTNAGLGVNVVSLHEQVVGNVRPLVTLLQLAVMVMLAIACANVANLLLGQAAGRQSELATRVALGASRAQIVRQLLGETLVIAIPGGLAGFALAVAGVRALLAMAPPELPRVSEVGVDGAVLAFTAAVTMVTVVAFGLGPALRGARTSLAASARPGTRVAGDRSVRWWHRVLAIGELALAQVLLVGAGLLLASFLAAQRVELGFVPEGRVAADLSLAPERYARPRSAGAGGNGTRDASAGFSLDPTPKRQLVASVLNHMRGMPGVRAVAASFTAPMAGAPNRGVRVEGVEVSGLGPGVSGLEQDVPADFQVVTPDYFRALGMTLVKGRAFDARDRDGAPKVVVVNQVFAARYLPGRDPLGHIVVFGGTSRHEIVGVVADARYRSVESAAEPTFYVPLEQNDEGWPFLSFTAWTDGDAAALGPAFREAVRAADPNQPVARVRTYDEILSGALASRRFNTLLVGAFAVTALLLAAVGTYGVMAYGVTARRRELGVRAALGATPGQLVWMVVREGARMVAAAIVAGAALAFAGSGLISGLLYGITPGDPSTFALVSAMLGGIAIGTSWCAARLIARASPVGALRRE